MTSYVPMPSFLPAEPEKRRHLGRLWTLIFALLFPVPICKQEQLPLQFPDSGQYLIDNSGLAVTSEASAKFSPPTPETENRARYSRFVGRILNYLYEVESRESDPHVRCDVRISWLTVHYAYQEVSEPHVVATSVVLGVHPDQVWPRLLADRKAKLGQEYSDWFDEAGLLRPDIPKKQSSPANSASERKETA